MNVKEFRIGNYLINSTTNEILEIVGLTKRDVTFSSNFDATNKVNPIPITKHWLLGFGFVIDPKPGNECYFKDKYSIDEFVLYVSNGLFCYDKGNSMIELSYIHKLQNLYFDLTGTELIRNSGDIIDYLGVNDF